MTHISDRVTSAFRCADDCDPMVVTLAGAVVGIMFNADCTYTAAIVNPRMDSKHVVIPHVELFREIIVEITSDADRGSIVVVLTAANVILSVGVGASRRRVAFESIALIIMMEALSNLSSDEEKLCELKVILVVLDS